MTPDEYLAAIHLALVESSIIVRYRVVRQRVTSQRGHLRVRADLSNGDFLEAAEFFGLSPGGVQVLDYRHQWMNGERTVLRKRWDSTPHYPALEKAPHHVHDGSEDSVLPGESMSIQAVLAQIEREISVDD
jgi:hypothetical protein